MGRYACDVTFCHTDPLFQCGQRRYHIKSTVSTSEIFLIGFFMLLQLSVHNACLLQTDHKNFISLNTTRIFQVIESRYVGESEIIHDVGTFWSRLYCWLGTTRYTWSPPLLPLWCRCDLDSPFLSWGLCHKHGHSNFICTKEEQRAVIHFCGLKVYQVPKCIEWCHCSEQCHVATDCLWMGREVQKWSHKR